MDAQPNGARDRRDPGLPESHTSRIFVETDSASPNFTAVGAQQFQAWNLQVRVHRGDWAMWIIWYVAMMASLSAMGLAPHPVPIRTDEDRKPYGDF